MRTFSSLTVRFETYDDEDNLWEVCAYITGTVDGDYGADADGNRGTKELFIDNYYFAEWFFNGTDTREIEVPSHIKQDLKEQATSYKNWEVE